MCNACNYTQKCISSWKKYACVSLLLLLFFSQTHKHMSSNSCSDLRGFICYPSYDIIKIFQQSRPAIFNAHTSLPGTVPREA